MRSNGNQKKTKIKRKGSGISLKLDRSAIDNLVVSLNVLQRWDHTIQEILGHATHVVIYIYNAESMEWERKEVEGSFFVVRRQDGVEPQHRLVVLNRLSLENLGHDLTGDFRIDMKPPYLIYRHREYIQQDRGEIYGVWFHDEAELKEMHLLILRVLASEFGSGAPPVARAVSAEKGQQMRGTPPSAHRHQEIQRVREREELLAHEQQVHQHQHALPGSYAKAAAPAYITRDHHQPTKDFLRSVLQVSPSPSTPAEVSPGGPMILKHLSPVTTPQASLPQARAPPPQEIQLKEREEEQLLFKKSSVETSSPAPPQRIDAASLLQQCLGLNTLEQKPGDDISQKEEHGHSNEIKDYGKPSPNLTMAKDEISQLQKSEEPTNYSKELLTPDALLQRSTDTTINKYRSRPEDTLLRAISHTKTEIHKENNNSSIIDKQSLKQALLDIIEDDHFLTMIHKKYIQIHNKRSHH